MSRCSLVSLIGDSRNECLRESTLNQYCTHTLFYYCHSREIQQIVLLSRLSGDTNLQSWCTNYGRSHQIVKITFSGSSFQYFGNAGSTSFCQDVSPPAMLRTENIRSPFMFLLLPMLDDFVIEATVFKKCSCRILVAAIELMPRRQMQ
jgi:hypothetical protein